MEKVVRELFTFIQAGIGLALIVIVCLGVGYELFHYPWLIYILPLGIAWYIIYRTLRERKLKK